MNLFKRLKEYISKPSNSTLIDEFIKRYGVYETNSGVSVSDITAMRVATVWRCVQILAGSISTLPMDVIKRVDEHTRKPAVNHPLRKILTVRPNKWQTPKEFKSLMQTHLCMRGNAFAFKSRLGGKIQELWPLHPDRVEVVQNYDFSLTYKVQTTKGETKEYTKKDIFHLRGMSLDGVTGLSNISYMREAVGLAIQSEKAGSRLYKSGNLAGGILEYPTTLSKEAYQNLQTSMEERYSGSDNASKWMILENGMKAQKLTLSATDAQFLESRDFQRYDIAMFFGVPPHMLGATDKQTSWGSGIEQQGIGFVTYTLNDWIKTWEETIKRDLLDESEWEDTDIRIFTQGLLRGDSAARKEYYASGLQWGWLSPNEVRELEDMNPRPDGDTYYDPPNTAGTPAQEEPQQGEQNNESTDTIVASEEDSSQ